MRAIEDRLLPPTLAEAEEKSPPGGARALPARGRPLVGLVLASLPSFFVLRLVNGVFILRALWCEFVLRRTLTVYEKGHQP